MMRNALVLVALAGAIACGSGGGAADLDAGPVSPASYEDSLIGLDDVSANGAHILETRAHPDGTVFYCSGRQSLTMVSAADAENMSQMGTLISGIDGQRCQHLAWSGDLLYFTNHGSDHAPTPFVSVFDRGTFPPQEVATFTHPSWLFEGIAVVGDMVYVAVHEQGIAVLENTGGPQLQMRGSVATVENAFHVAANGTLLYVADGGAGLSVVDASNPASPQLRGTVDVGGAAQSVQYDATTQVAYVAAGSAGLIAVDVSNPDAPSVLDVADTPGSALQVSLQGGHAFVADWNDARVFDISDPTDMQLVATERVSNNRAFTRVLGVAARDDMLFVGEWDGLYAHRFYPERRAPDVWVADESIDFGSLGVGDSDAVAVIVANEGLEPLVITDVASSNSAFTIEPTQMSLAPGGAGVFELVYQASSDAEVDAVLTLSSDDPDEPTREIELLANQPGIGVGDAAPAVTVDLVEGGSWSLSDEPGSVVLLAYFATF